MTIAVLIVEDFAITAKFLSSALRVSKHSVVYTADSAERGLKLVQEMGETIDLIMVDLLMAGMGGLACIEKLRELEREKTWHYEIVAMSADDSLNQQALDRGANVFLHKLDKPVAFIIEIVKRIVAEKIAAGIAEPDHARGRQFTV